MEELFESSDEYLDETYGDDWVDITDKVQCYEHGKTFECECGQGFGIEHEVPMKKCPSCHKICVDLEAEEREAPDRDQDQSSLNNWT